MLNCSNIKKLFNLKKLQGTPFLSLNIKDIKEEDIKDLEECGYVIIRKKNQVIIKE